MDRLLRALLPDRLGRDFRLLFGSHAASNLADGILLAAGPLLVTAVTRDPFLVSMAVFAQRLPWLVVGIPAGAVVDRVDRRALMAAVHVVRAATVAVLAVVVAADGMTLPLLYGLLFALGTAETFGDNAATTMVGATVPSAHLGLANSRLVGARITTNQLAGPPLGAVLFAVGMATPFAVDAALLALAAVVVVRIGTDGRAEARGARPTMRVQVGEGIAWLRGNAPVRRLAVLIGVFNVTFGAVWGILVLYALERLGLDDLGFGLLLAASAVGGVVGSVLFERLERRWSYATLLRVGLLVETFTHAGLALTSSWLVAGLVLLAFGAHAATWGSVSITIRLRAVPEALLGRVNSVYLLASVGGLAIGTPIGGLVAARFGVLATFWFAFVGAGLTTLWTWRSIDDVGSIGETEAAAATSAAP